MKRRYAVGGALVALVGALQVLPLGRPSNPVSGNEPPWDRPRTREIFFRACGDCHSNDTRWPWYAHVAPVSWYVVHHVEEGRRALNVSRWSDAMLDAVSEAGSEIEKRRMPLPSYLRLHHEAKLTEAEKAELVRGLAASLEPRSIE